MGPAERALLRDETAAADELQLRLHVLRAAVATRQEAQWAARRTPKQGGFKQQQNGPAKGASVEELWLQKRSGGATLARGAGSAREMDSDEHDECDWVDVRRNDGTCGTCGTCSTFGHARPRGAAQ